MSSRDASRLFASLTRDRVTLALETTDLCFLGALHLLSDERALASFDEETLLDTFEQVCDAVEPGANNPRLRATNAIRKLREQRMLARVDGGLLVRTGDYALTRLAAAVVEFYLSDDALTRESLTLLTATLKAQLAQVLALAKKAQTEDDWREVTAPLRVTVTDLVSGIERRQRGLDTQQEEVQAEIARVLSADWFGAVDRCQALLETTTATLRELSEVLLRDTTQLTTLLQEVQALAGEESDAELAVQRVIEHVDRIGAWGRTRLHAWSDYYHYVHRYLRDVVRLDPDRALSQRLRDQLVSWPEAPFFCKAASEPTTTVLRRVDARVERPPVSRPRADREVSPERVTPIDLQRDLEALVLRAMESGATTLAEVTALVLQEVEPPLHYVSAGRVAELVARAGPVWSEREAPWRHVAGLELEDWDLEGP